MLYLGTPNYRFFCTIRGTPRDDVSPLKLPFGGCIRLWDKPVWGIHQYFAIYDVPMMSMGLSNITKSDFHLKCSLFSAWSIFGSPLKKCHLNWWLWLWCFCLNIFIYVPMFHIYIYFFFIFFWLLGWWFSVERINKNSHPVLSITKRDYLGGGSPWFFGPRGCLIWINMKGLCVASGPFWPAITVVSYKSVQLPHLWNNNVIYKPFFSV